MIGITSYGIYTPYYRLNRDAIRNSWEVPSSIKGEKAIANYDEDSVTMASESVFNCLATVNHQVKTDGLFFATTSYPFPEKQGATIVSAIADFPEEVIATDFSRSMRSGVSALGSALDAVAGGSAKNVLVVAADCRMGEPGSDEELILGDGSASLLVGDTNVIASKVGRFSISSDFTDFLRKDGEACIRRMDDLRLINTLGYNKKTRECIGGILKKCGLGVKDITKLICPSPEPTAWMGVARGLGFDTKSQLQNPFFDKIGNIGTAHPLLMLAAALDEAKSGDKILVCGYGDGAEAFIFQVTPGIDQIKNRGKVTAMISSGKLFTNYPRYLSTRNLLEKEKRPLRPFFAPAQGKREEKQNVRRYGKKCQKCGFVQYPMRRVCLNCRTKDEMEDYRLSDWGEIFSYTREYYIPVPPLNPPMAMVVVDMEGGGRMCIQMTDHEFEEVKIGNKVRLTYRKIFEYGDIINYFWKCTPVREWR